MMRKVIKALMLALAILLLTPSLLLTTIGDGAGSENYVVDVNPRILWVVNSAGASSIIYQFTSESNAGGAYSAVIVIDPSGNYIAAEINGDKLSKVTPTGVWTAIYNFPAGTEPVGVAIDSSGNYIVCEFNAGVLSKITPDGVRTVICKFTAGTYPVDVLISTAPDLFFADVTENGLEATWTQSADPSFAGYQLYQSSARGELGSLIGTNTDIADTSLAVTGLSPGTTYYFTIRVLGANGAYVDSGQGSGMTTKAFWQERWFPYVVFAVAVVAVVAIAIYVVHSRSKKKAQVT